MKTSIATVSISGAFADKLEAIAAAGFDGIEIFEQDFLASDFTPAEVGRMVADAPAIEMDALYLSRHFRNMPGEGDLDLPAFMRAVAATGYAGPLSLEIFNDQFRAGLPRLVAADGHRSLIALMDEVRRAEPSLKVDLPAFPAPAPVEKVACLEFATAPDDAPALHAFLSAAGFAQAGAHVSKPVSLWRQGDVNILVNTDQAGFSFTAYVAHGTTVSEIALLVPDAAAAHARATALLAQPHVQPAAPGELEIPAVRGVGGSLIRFLDHGPHLSRIWSTDFRSAPAPFGAGLTGIDHIGQTMLHDEMLSWALFYAAIFGAAKSPMVDVADPDGLVRSQAIRSGGLRITLNGAGTRRTLAGQFVEDTFGAAVQHVAFATADIFATADALAAAGFPLLPIGANYYADIAARFGLDPGLVARMQAANILYDEDEGGTFFQLYSIPWPDGFFFEIVQRQGNYRGYGAPNAPFRIAAQKRHGRPAGLPRS